MTQRHWQRRSTEVLDHPSEAAERARAGVARAATWPDEAAVVEQVSATTVSSHQCFAATGERDEAVDAALVGAAIVVARDSASVSAHGSHPVVALANARALRPVGGHRRDARTALERRHAGGDAASVGDARRRPRIGQMSTRSARSRTCPADGWVQLGTGNRARYPVLDEPVDGDVPGRCRR